ncbi:P-loop containing nucleoside triphosphate hydrolase protein [Roridomyces roridus]|uniref:P-loop containing nucleoside triphosphate hydrolase protein n=1 Tax=Roridomyces roridus TaxID=1738132 RepID=A0AAD7BW59_9AGAR|nr:P-loop containing nucleoside triphosphate hydrolase protein [Roridomyces roridus]
MPPKRKSGSESDRPSKKRKSSNTEVVWPQYFHDVRLQLCPLTLLFKAIQLFKVFKALNTVLAFVSSRKHLATSFNTIRASVESLLKRPLDLENVAAIKSLCPELVKFAYVPRNEILVQDALQPSKEPSFQIGDYSSASSERKEDHILILEFMEKSSGKKAENPTQSLTAPPALTPAAMKKLVEKRNEKFSKAVDELITATADGEDPAVLLKAAAREHIPINPSDPTTWPSFEIPSPTNRPSIDSVLSDITGEEWYAQHIVERRTIEAKVGQTGTLDSPLSDTIANALQTSRSISSLYTHQTAALNAINAGKHVIVSTSTASGKSVIYQVPVLQFLEANPHSTAMFVYPTKALAQDQRAALEQLLACCPGLEHLQVKTYDGDTPREARAGIRETASDMLHAAILPFEDGWRTFLKNLKIFAVDELHYYSGALGSHVAQITRRFRRVLAALGNTSAIFVSCSATISRPSAHMQRIFGIDSSDVEVVTEDGAPSGIKDMVIWNAPANDDRPISSISEATNLMKFLMKRGVRVILFCKFRKVCELAMKSLRLELTKEGRLDILERVRSYRGGYSQEDRRRIEHDAFTGHLLGIVATNALELGVDIGVLDGVIMLGFPGSIASFRQQAGRAGRRARDSLAILVAECLPVDQYYVNNPQELFEGKMDDLVVDLDNKILLEAHLQCAAHEMPICDADTEFFGPLMKELCQTRLRVDSDDWYHTHPKFLPYPSKHVFIRGIQEERYTVVDITSLSDRSGGGSMYILEEVEISRALFEIYEGGVFIHQGLTYIIKEISHDSKVAKVVRADINWITAPRDFTNVDAIQTYRIKEIKKSPHLAFYGRIDIQVIVFGYYKIRNNTILDTVSLDSEPWEHETTGFWMDLPAPTLELLRSKNFKPAAAIHSAEHGLLNQFILSDVKTECKAIEKENKLEESARKRPARLIFYDAVGSGGGVCTRAFDNVHELLCKAEQAIGACACDFGCTKCIHSARCKEKNEVSSKLGALLVIRGLLGIDVDPDSIPGQDAEEGHDTIVAPLGVGAMTGVKVERDT